MKPFNLEDAKAGKPVQTRDGRSGRILCFGLKSSDNKFPIATAVTQKDGTECILTHTEQGYYTYGDSVDCDDLVMASARKEGWINIYADNVTTRFIYSSEELAKAKAGSNAIATVKIEWEE